MAARTGTQLQLVCCTFEGKKFNVNLREGMRTRDIITEAARIVNVRPERLSILWCGQVIQPDVPIQDAIANRSATDLHLVQLERADSFTADRTVADGQIYVYCKECEDVAVGRQILICSKCNEKNTFVRHPSDGSIKSMFETEHKIDGVCTNPKCPSKKETVTAQVRYQCKGCDNSAAVLKHVQQNTKNIPCMKCNNARSIMIVFCCDFLHAICQMCFSGYCQMQMNNKKFQIFDNVGYSISCPAASCQDAPVRDPHHFYLVNKKKFYDMFQYEAAKCYQPAGNNIFCTCYTEIVVGSGGSDAVAATRESTEQGGRWWSREGKSSKKSSAKKKPAQRRRVTCPNTECGKAYCVECKSFWHEDNCVEKAGPSEDDVFDVYYGESARWPKHP